MKFSVNAGKYSANIIYQQDNHSIIIYTNWAEVVLDNRLIFF